MICNMREPKDNGGTAFPYNQHSNGCDGMSLRDYFAIHAPNEGIDAIMGVSIKDVKVFMGLLEGEGYNSSVHYPQANAKARYAFADAMIKARRQ